MEKIDKEVDTDMDDEHGKQLFLDAKHRLTHVSNLSFPCRCLLLMSAAQPKSLNAEFP